MLYQANVRRFRSCSSLDKRTRCDGLYFKYVQMIVFATLMTRKDTTKQVKYLYLKALCCRWMITHLEDAC